MTSQVIYEKNDMQVIVSDKFIYNSCVYVLWKGGAALWEENYYSSNKPLKLRKKDIKVKYKNYSLFRFFELQFAPEEYLKNQGFKLKKV